MVALVAAILFYFYTRLVQKIDKLKLEYHSKMTDAVHKSELAGTQFKLSYWSQLPWV
jgi:hypothetical protein